MAYELENGVRVAIYFADQEFDFSKGNILNFLHMAESTRLGVPMIHLSLTDTSGWFTDNPVLGDGIVIRVDITRNSGDNSNNTVTEFALNFFNETATTAGKVYKIDGYYNVPIYWAASTSTPVKGTAYDVLSKICDATELTLDAQGTNDSQIWYPRNEPFYKFAKRVTSYGYVSDNSCLSMAVSMDGYLYLRDISQMDDQAYDFGLYDFTNPDVFTVVGYKPFVASGAFNQLGGYSFESVEQSMAKADTRVFTSVQFKANESGSLMVNNDIRDKLPQSRVAYAPIDVGNTHDEFQRAYYQNQRVANLFTSGLEILTDSMTDVSVLSTVRFNTPQEINSTVVGIDTYSGTYRVTSKTIYIRNARYVEKFELVRRTLNTLVPSATTGDAAGAQLNIPIEFKVPSLSNFSVLDAISLVGSISNGLPDSLSSAVDSAESTLSGLASSAASAVSGPMSALTSLTSSVSASMASINTSALASISAAKAANLAAHTAWVAAGSIPPAPVGVDLVALATSASASIAGVLSASASAIAIQQNRAISVGGIKQALSSKLDGLTSQLTSSCEAAATEMTGLMDSIADTTIASLHTSFGSVVSSASSAEASVSSEVTSAQSALSSAISQASSAMTTLNTASSNYASQLMTAATT